MNMTRAARRQIALYHLRVNPKNRKQGKKELFKPDTDEYCALGLLGEAFGYEVTTSPHGANLINQVYGKMCDDLGVDAVFIYHRNDGGMTFSEIAKALEKCWESDD